MRLKTNQNHSAIDEDELAVALKTTRVRIFKLYRSGAIPGYRLGKTLRFFLPEVLESLRNPNPRGKGTYKKRPKKEAVPQ
jgi:hypothetical protein